MAKIVLATTDQRLIRVSCPMIASGDKHVDYLKVDCCPSWDGFSKTAVFYRDGDNVYFANLDANNECEIPWEVLQTDGDLYLGVIGVKGDLRQTTEVISYKIDKGAIVDNLTPSDPTPDIFDFILSRYGVEPNEEDIPKVFFGEALPQTKDDAVMSFRYISKTRDIKGYCKTKAQGSSSMGYPKKNQTVKLYADEFCTEKLNVNFKGWGKQNKFCFKANWTDLTHARNVVSARLWGDVVRSRPNYANLPELYRTSPNVGAVDGFPVKVYANGIYQGRYTLNIPKDAWMANMNDSLDTHCILCGEGYGSGCFRAEAVIDESDWTDEVHDTVPDSIKTRWNEVISFVMNSTDEEFIAGIDSYIDLDSLIDYHIFGLVTCNIDGFGRNQLYHTYDGQKWYAGAYDLDCTWGLWWSASYSREEYLDFQYGEGNLLYIRIADLFHEEIKARYKELRAGALSVENIINRFERFTDIAPPYLVAEDYAKTTADGAFTEIPSQDTNIQQIRKYIVDRLNYVDGLMSTESDILFEVTQEIELDGVDGIIDTGVSPANLDEYTIVIDFTPYASTGTFIDNYGNSYGWILYATGKDNDGVPVLTYEDDENIVGIRQKIFGRKNSTGNIAWISANGSRLGIRRTFPDGDTGERIIIGGKLLGGAYADFATMTVHEARIYNRVLSDEEITAQMPESVVNINDGVYEDGRFASAGAEHLDDPNYSFRNANYLPVEGGKTIVYELDGRPDDFPRIPKLQIVQFDADKNVVIARTEIYPKTLDGMQWGDTPDSLTLDASTAFIRGCFYLQSETEAKLRDTIRFGIYYAD